MLLILPCLALGASSAYWNGGETPGTDEEVARRNCGLGHPALYGMGMPGTSGMYGAVGITRRRPSIEQRNLIPLYFNLRKDYEPEKKA
ncbi:hypothetical protein RvY_01283 [Ramazzottius varieornatus]|uniref:Uncharacterized protein n=1 Tax=Ramazzottius varieornatus TaxID=947166 RepID=A0A1D1UFR4_RAMVA|nr:hypothetical protein RvY_01283 [Ramazzottius varieornatus]